MGSPTIFSGRYTKLLTSKGILNSDGSINQFDGSKNYIPYGQFEQNVTTGWSLFNTTLTSGLPTGTLGAGAASLALTTTSTNPLSGSYSLQVAAGTAWTAGQGVISNAFTVDRADLGKVLTFSISYEATVGGSVANWSGILGSQTLAVYLYDVTASAWVQPAGFLGMNQNSGAGRVTGTFQTSVTSGQQYQLAIVALQATASPVTITLDQISCGPLTAPLGAAVTDFVDKGTTTVGAVTTAPTKGTVAIDKVLMRRVGDCAALIYEYFQTAAGSAGSGTYLFSLPAGMSFDTTKIATVSTSAGNRNAGTLIGYGSSGADVTVGYSANLNVYAINSTQFIAVVTSAQQTAGTVDPGVDEPIGSANFNFGYSQYAIKLYITAPIAGWSSNVQVSSDTDTRVVAMSAEILPSTTITAGTDLVFNTKTIDTHGAYNASTGVYTVPVSGVYDVSLVMYNTSAQCALYVKKNGSAIDGSIQNALITSASTSNYGAGSRLVSCNAGDTLSVASNQSVTAANVGGNVLQIKRLSGPSVIAATESVNARYTDVSGQAIGTSAAVFKFGTKDFDSHLAYSSSTGLYTCPVSGKYKVDARLFTAAVTLSAASGALLSVYKNGVFYSYIGKIVGTGVSNVVSYGGSDIVNCVAGDTLAVWTQSDVATTGSTVAGANHVTFERVGN